MSTQLDKVYKVSFLSFEHSLSVNLRLFRGKYFVFRGNLFSIIYRIARVLSKMRQYIERQVKISIALMYDVLNVPKISETYSRIPH